MSKTTKSALLAPRTARSAQPIPRRTLVKKEARPRPNNIHTVIDIESAIQKKAPYSVTKCGDCQYFKGGRHPNYDAPCSEMGRVASGVAPTCFVPNVNALKSKGTQMATALNVLAGQLNAQQLRVIGTLMVNSTRIRKLGFEFLERVYFPVGNARYLSNYYSGFVVGSAGYDRNLMVLGSSRTGSTTIVAHLDRESVLNLAAFSERRDLLVRKGLIYDPATVQRKPPVLTDDSASNYAPPMIDTPIEALEARAASRRQKTLAPGRSGEQGTSRVELVFS